MKTIKTDILILGGGLGGYEAYRSLVKQFALKKIKKQITLVDKNDYFSFIPLLHEVAAGSISPNHTQINLYELLQGTPHTFVQTSVQSIDPEKKKVTTEKGIFTYDYCIVALGSTVNYFGIPGAEEYCKPVRTYDHAVELQKTLQETLRISYERPVTINIIGGGYTGIEIAGQVHEVVDVHKHKNRKIHPIQVNIIEGAGTILGLLPEKVQKTITRVLKKSGVVIYTGKKVARVNPDSIVLEDGSIIPNSLAIWSGGVKNVADGLLPATYTEKGRIPTTPQLTHPNDSSLYAIGDISLAKNTMGQPIPQLGEAAHREGEYVAVHLTTRLISKKPFNTPFNFTSKGTLIPVGSRFGAAVIGPFIFFGALAWYLRRIVYLMFIPGLKNKLHIIIDWTLRRYR